MDKAKTKVVIYTLLISSFLVSVYAIAQHFGIDKKIWADDVVNRVFSTIGQPNWLAAFVTAITPITWGLLLKSRIINHKSKLHIEIQKSALFLLSNFLFASLIFTKSRSGFIGFAISALLFWVFFIFTKIRSGNLKFKTFQIFILLATFYMLLTTYFGSPWTSSIESRLVKTAPDATKRAVSSVLESGSTGSGQIRKIVWRGAFEVWKNYPVIGSGVETFAYTYHSVKPAGHNETAEWDYLYNKAHNEYLNYLANNGVIGFLSYFIVIIFSVFQILNIKSQKLKLKNTDENSKITVQTFNFSILSCNFEFCLLHFALCCGFISLLVTNFFGFSVVSTSILFFLFPAMAFSLTQKPKNSVLTKKLNVLQTIAVVFLLLTTYFLLLTTYRYWYSDFLYAKANTAVDKGQIETAQKTGSKLLALSPKEPLYHNLQSRIYTETALYLAQNQKEEIYNNFIEAAVKEGQTAINLSPANVLYKKNLTSVYLNLATIDPKYLENAKEMLYMATVDAPTDAKLLYNLGLIYIKLGSLEEAKEVLVHTVLLKQNYASARYALALVYEDSGDTDEAKIQLNYILSKIDPNNAEAKRLLNEIQH